MDILLTFATTHNAIRAERLLLQAGLPVRVMPLPGEIRAGCGLGMRVPLPQRQAAEAALRQGGTALEGCYMAESYKAFPAPVFTGALGIGPGDVISLIGCGGKTSLMYRLAAENRHLPVLLSTTTKILPPPDSVIDYSPAPDGILPAGVSLLCSAAGRKLGGIDSALLTAHIPPEGITLLEADGSRGLPLKGWAAYEPVIHPRTTATVGIAVVWPVGRSGRGLVQRPELYTALTGTTEEEPICTEHIAAMITQPGGMFAKARGRKILFINQVEAPPDRELAMQLAALLPPDIAVFAGSVQQESIFIIEGDTS